MKDRFHISVAIVDFTTGKMSLKEAVDEILKVQSKSTRFNFNSFILGFAGGFILFLVTALILHGNNVI